MNGFVAGLIVPGLPHPLLAADQSPAWMALRKAYEAAGAQIAALQADVLVLYSTQWVSVIGHQIQADPHPEWVHVDQDWHGLGSMPYRFRIDSDYATAWEAAGRARGLHTRTVNYKGFPMDTGSIVALKLLNPDNRLPACVVSCNMYADRAETLVLGKAAADALGGRRAVAVAVTGLSNRMFPHPIEPAQDRISSHKDDEWNKKMLEILGAGRLEDASQLARQFSLQANGDSKMKALWWLAAAMGQHNAYEGRVYAYQPIWGTGAAVVSLIPSAKGAADQEFDEDDVERFSGDRNVLTSVGAQTVGAGVPPAHPKPAEPRRTDGGIKTDAAPVPVGPYPHARRVGELLFVSGMGPRQPVTNEIPGGPVRDAAGNPLPYDVRAQTRATIENIATVLKASGSDLSDVVDVTCFLIDMQRDFAAFNEVYGEYFAKIGPTRTTLEVRALPTPIAVELKVVAKPPQ